jgi:soluble cytochrome b562
MNNNSLKEVSDRHRLIMFDLVLEGLADREICDKYDLSQARLCQLKKSPLWKKESALLVDEHLAGHKHRMQTLIPLAIDTLKETMQHGYLAEVMKIDPSGEVTDEVMLSQPMINPPATRANAALGILDRSGLAKGGEGAAPASVTIQLYAPAWNQEDGVGKVIDVELDS